MSAPGTVALPRPRRDGHSDGVPLRRVLQVLVCVLALSSPAPGRCAEVPAPAPAPTADTAAGTASPAAAQPVAIPDILERLSHSNAFIESISRAS